MTMPLDLDLVRKQFPALDRPVVYLDNPGGTQICRQSLDGIQDYLVRCNANHGGAFATSRDSDAMVAHAREVMADFLHAARPEEIIFGLNMTTLTFHISRSLGATFAPGDLLAVTRLDHDGNISPWLKVAEDRGLRVRWIDFHPEDGTLDLDDLQAALAEGPRLLAVGYASNALGTINPIRQITQWAHEAGALVYVDAVQYAPHGPIDVQDLGCDFLVCSAYKFFGPHLGVLYGRYDLLDALPAYRVRPAPAEPPEKFETGTGSFESIAGLVGALAYFEWLGQTFGEEFVEQYAGEYSGRALTFKQAMAAVRSYEYELSRTLLDGLAGLPGVQVYGLRDLRRLEERLPTVSFTMDGWHPQQLAARLNESGIYVWDGNYYALAVTERLGLEERGGMVRVGPVHYNSCAEVEQLLDVLR
ncbi:MAG: cysteine desulfurase-like protein, partial [Chloroflexi bacterium]|nr:cysteine desulfurase-like protein [Chloroflexota bacterium]